MEVPKTRNSLAHFSLDHILNCHSRGAVVDILDSFPLLQYSTIPNYLSLGKA